MFASPDGLRFRQLSTVPVVSDPVDTQNVALWDLRTGTYRAYLRGVEGDSHDAVAADRGGDRGPGESPGSFKGGYRGVRITESADFRTWDEPVLLPLRDANDPTFPEMHIYTSAALKYPHADQAYFLFPRVLYLGRKFPGAPKDGLADIQFMSSRDGVNWDRRFRTPYLRAGQDPRNWVDRALAVGTGIAQTGAGELSLYYTEFFRDPTARIRRAALRKDGFVSLSAPYERMGSFVSRALVLDGDRLQVNFRTSAGGSIRLQLLGDNGHAVPGFTFADCDLLFGDTTGHLVSWRGRSELSLPRGSVIRLAGQLRDADLFSFRFDRASSEEG